MRELFYHRKRVKPNGHIEEITLGNPFARVLIFFMALIGAIVLAMSGASLEPLMPLIKAFGR